MKTIRNIKVIIYFLITILMVTGCQQGNNQNAEITKGDVKLITLDPSHFHAALVQKSMYPGIDSVVHVYAPKGLGLDEQLNYIKQYNSRAENPTHWVEKVYSGNDYLQKMLEDKSGNVVVLAGNNLLKSEYIKKSVDDGLNVLADKPMAINTKGFDSLKQAFADAKEKGVLLYDIMTERSVAASILQKKLAHMPSLFGELEKGTTDSPAVIMESVHRYFKQVSGKPLIRPDWFFDPLQQGDAIVDVGTHLVDLVQWICFPDVSLDYTKDIAIQSSKIWPTPINLSQFSTITNEDHFPGFLNKYLKDDSILLTHGNGSINYTIKGIHTRVTAEWTYDAPKGAGDTYYSMLAGTKAHLEIRQSEEESWQATLYIWPTKSVKDIKAFTNDLDNAINEINKDFPGVELEKYKNGWKVVIPEKYMEGHEAHFAEVMKRYLQYLKEGKLPEWEVPDMLTKYYTTTKALEMAQQ
ncbi:MAG: putative oxidoreductase C-terminal domain-containing protein [Bacteroidota bacterium]|nr:putative oxidoreductase C-terminal domain-containing protein [Bacteroidota bacterium]